MKQFLTENDLQVVRLGSEIMFLQQLTDALQVENKQVIDNLKTTLAAKEAIEGHAKQLELQIERLKEHIRAMEYYERDTGQEKDNPNANGQEEVLQQPSAKTKSNNPERNGNGKASRLRRSKQNISA